LGRHKIIDSQELCRRHQEAESDSLQTSPHLMPDKTAIQEADKHSFDHVAQSTKDRPVGDLREFVGHRV